MVNKDNVQEIEGNPARGLLAVKFPWPSMLRTTRPILLAWRSRIKVDLTTGAGVTIKALRLLRSFCH